MLLPSCNIQVLFWSFQAHYLTKFSPYFAYLWELCSTECSSLRIWARVAIVSIDVVSRLVFTWVCTQPSDSCVSPGGDSSDLGFVVHHIWVGVSIELFGSLTPITSFQSFWGSERYYSSEVSEFSKLESWLSSHLGKTLENHSLPTKTLLPWMTLIFSSSLHVPHGNWYLGILQVKATAVSMRLRIYLFA